MQNGINFVILHTEKLYCMDNVFANRLINARKIRGLSQRGLCEALDGKVSPNAVAKYEKGSMMPSSSTLILLSRALGVNMDYFFRPFSVHLDPSCFKFRKKAGMSVKKVEAVKYLVCSEIEKYIEIESLLGMRNGFSLDYSDSPVKSESDAMAAAMRFRQDLNIGTDAIVSAVDLMESLGVKIIEIDFDDSFSGTCNEADDIPVIVVNRNMTSERKRITIFHELGHLILRCPEDVDEEKMFTVFANEVLIPSGSFKALIGESRNDISLVELQAIQREYGISVDALMYKAALLGIISEHRFVSFHKKKNALPAFKADVQKSLYPMENTSRFERLVYRALASEIISASKASALLEVPVDLVLDKLSLM